MRLPIYLDYMATTPVDPRVKETMLGYLDYEGEFGNPASSLHPYGWRAREAVEKARAQVAALANVDSQEIIWTSGATESNNLALKGAANFYRRRGNHLVTVATEHNSVLDVCRFLETQGFTVTYLKPEPNGLVELAKLEAALRPETVLVSVMLVNNEIGVVQDLAAIAEVVKARGILLHADAAQAAGKIALDFQTLPVDLASFSAHKVYGPKGVGALYMRRRPQRVRLEPQIHGGGHEFGMRAGTLAPHQLVGMGVAFELARQELAERTQHITALRDSFWERIKGLPGLILHGDLVRRVPHNLNISFRGIKGEELLPELSELALSTGSACRTASLAPSHVLTALGVSTNQALGAVRITFGNYNTLNEIEYASTRFSEAVAKLGGS